jgi:hypothetical protein
MGLPFSREQFFETFAQYNATVWPVQPLLVALGVASIVAVFLQRGFERVVGWVLALFWLWMAIAYHFTFFTRINPAARVFGVAFLLAGGSFAWHAHAGTLRFTKPIGATGVGGLAVLFYSLVGYPFLGWLSGHAYPETPTFGLPCPTTIFTFGILLLARHSVPPSLLIVPLAWTVVGTFAAIQLGVPQDFGLLAAAMITIVSRVGRSKAQRSAAPAAHLR